MAEGATKKGPNKKKGKGDGLSQKMDSLSLDGSGDKRTLSLFPARPPRALGAIAPGTKVDLLTNLFKISLLKSKPIYRYPVNTEIEKYEDEAVQGKDPATTVQRKLGRDIRRAAVQEAIKTWIIENKPNDYSKSLEFNYVLDNTAANLFGLFNMFAKPGSNKSQEFRVKLNLDTFKEGKVVKEPRYFRVKIFEGTLINMSVLFDFCTQKPRNSDIAIIQEHLRTLDVLLRGKICTMPHNVLTKTGVFPCLKENQAKIGDGVLLTKGYVLSARPTESGVVVNVANTFAPFHEEIDLTDLLLSRCGRSWDLNKPLPKDKLENFKKELINKQVEAKHKNFGTEKRPHYRKYRVGDITGSSLDKFTLVDKKTKAISEITIADYFHKEYNYKIKYPKLPCVVDKGRKLPIEVCHLIDKQRVMRKMTPEETANTIKKAALPPQEHFQMVEKNAKEVFKNRAPLNDFGFEFTPEFIKVQGREIAPLRLIGGTKKDITPFEGGYNVNSDKFYKPAKVAKWGMLFLVDGSVEREMGRDPTLYTAKFSDLYCSAGRNKGVQVNPMVGMQTVNMRLDEPKFKQSLKEQFKAMNKFKLDHVIIVLPEGCPDWIYRYVQYLEVSHQEGRGPNENWTRVSCLKFKNYMSKIIQDRFNGSMFLSNLWLKYNTKLGGINFVLKEDRNRAFLQDGYLFLSVDVCHPAPGDKLIQSVAAVVGMWDLTNPNFSYCTRMRVQKKVGKDNSTIEEVGELGIMVGEVLDSYHERKKRYPTNIMILRDGVSEGQFKIVLNSELARVHAQVSNVYGKSKQPLPKISCLVVQKRHRVRFIREKPVSTRKGDDYNIQPGTVVDTTVVHPNDFSFYIAPHKAIQGTSRAAHIYVILDEIRMSQDQAQEMVYALSFLSPRCTKSTSIPTPVNLADLAAERGKNIVISWNDDNPGKLSDAERIQKLNNFLSNLADRNYKNTLFYI